MARGGKTTSFSCASGLSLSLAKCSTELTIKRIEEKDNDFTPIKKSPFVFESPAAVGLESPNRKLSFKKPLFRKATNSHLQQPVVKKRSRRLQLNP